MIIIKRPRPEPATISSPIVKRRPPYHGKPRPSRAMVQAALDAQAPIKPKESQ